VSIVDLGSSNGTFDGQGQRLTGSFVLIANQPVRVGTSELTWVPAVPQRGGTRLMAQVPAPGGTRVMSVAENVTPSAQGLPATHPLPASDQAAVAPPAAAPPGARHRSAASGSRVRRLGIGLAALAGVALAGSYVAGGKRILASGLSFANLPGAGSSSCYQGTWNELLEPSGAELCHFDPVTGEANWCAPTSWGELRGFRCRIEGVESGTWSCLAPPGGHGAEASVSSLGKIHGGYKYKFVRTGKNRLEITFVDVSGLTFDRQVKIGGIFNFEDDGDFKGVQDYLANDARSFHRSLKGKEIEFSCQGDRLHTRLLGSHKKTLLFNFESADPASQWRDSVGSP
jgi:hypothetical protein